MKVTLMMCLSQSILNYIKIKKILGEGSGCIIDLGIKHTISVSKYHLLAESS